MRELLIKQKVNDKVDEITDFIINEYPPAGFFVFRL
jgi:hypothetical protein